MTNPASGPTVDDHDDADHDQHRTEAVGEPWSGPAAIRLVAVAAGVLAVAVGLATRSWLGLDLPGAVPWMMLAAGLVVIIVRKAIGDHARRVVRRLVTAGAALIPLAGIVVAVAVPLELRRAEHDGTGVIWTADAVGNDHDLQPFAVIGETAVLQGWSRVVFLGLADGRVRGEIPLDSRQKLMVAGDRILVWSDSDDRIQLYDTDGRAVWPAPVAAEGALAADDDVVVLLSGCDDETCTLVGRGVDGRTVWQRRVPWGPDLAAAGLSNAINGTPLRLPSLVAIEEAPDRPDGNQPVLRRWVLIRATDAKPVGSTRGSEVLVLGDMPFTFVRSKGACHVSANGRRFSDDFNCPDPMSVRHRHDPLQIFDQIRDDRSLVVRLDRPGRPFPFLESAVAAGRLTDADFGALGWARLTNQVLEFWDWEVSDTWTGDPARSSVPLPIELADDAVEPTVAVDGGTAVVSGTAEPRHGDDRWVSQVIVFDFALGTETGRVRLESGSVPSHNQVLSTGPGQALICAYGQTPMLIGKRT